MGKDVLNMNKKHEPEKVRLIKLNYIKIENFYPTRDIIEITFLKSLKMEKIFIIYRAGEGSVSRKYKESLQINSAGKNGQRK